MGMGEEEEEEEGKYEKREGGRMEGKKGYQGSLKQE